MRHYDVANRTSQPVHRARWTSSPNDLWTFSVIGGRRQRRLPDSYFGLEESSFRRFRLEPTSGSPTASGAGGQLQLRTLLRPAAVAVGECRATAQETDPNRDWTADSAERVNYFSIYATPPRIGENTEVACRTTTATREGSYLYAVVPGGPLPAPSNQLPDVLQQAAAAPPRCQAPALEPLAATLLSLRAIPGLRLCVRSRPSSTALCSPARWCSDTSTGRTRRTQSCSASIPVVDPRRHVVVRRIHVETHTTE